MPQAPYTPPADKLPLERFSLTENHAQSTPLIPSRPPRYYRIQNTKIFTLSIMRVVYIHGIPRAVTRSPRPRSGVRWLELRRYLRCFSGVR
jgi:hypothetical protein